MHKLSSIMSKEVFKAPKMKRPQMKRTEGWSPARKRKVKNRFLSFCDIVLEYTNYENMKQEELRGAHNASPLDSGGSTAESFTSDSLLYGGADDDSRGGHAGGGFLSNGSSPDSSNERTNGAHYEDSFDSVTCFCRKPFAGRPMIECNKCLTWIHLSCAKIRRNNIPDEFTCQRCREARSNKRKSNRMRIEKFSSPPPAAQQPIVAQQLAPPTTSVQSQSPVAVAALS